ncbi:hypothetical protein TPADAL_0542a [Treponema pallidum subsp. pallidum DAL-1]|uniref:Uncharacterized protein n=2 Tax=Treponema pallidum TaxID=160 RepID=A0AAU8RMD1_TREPL|nr:hypothetical protein TPESAMD_0542a [Treponema pallidum subsp. pertenue str. SamoaD]AEZ58736.1 hypothetical protein TPECDC2_0542a [Treponema pallidum subsp. pertenue str. CDC2]AEZ59804.1 hypothetical protein TPEGAU_0542a [Treponema pallidum subsp. pertenue str. Gauthier]AEZ60867.1 hypothetical protein TPADAL_0542a [Treponema pallidum subsp. pallidum DAL-1]AGK84188.1 hypothetical protein TPFB_0542a [Treponema pallidum str. Fribourg-Blanc]AJB40564.1 hypothetical protein TENDBA_0542a [Treponema
MWGCGGAVVLFFVYEGVIIDEYFSLATGTASLPAKGPRSSSGGLSARLCASRLIHHCGGRL